MRECQCPQPNPFPAQHKAHSCVQCGLWINPAWGSTDANVRKFFDGLERGMFPTDPLGQVLVPEWFKSFRSHCERREKWGRDRFRYAYLDRDNPAEGTEEAADGALYSMLDILRAKREGRGDEDYDAALIAARHFALAHQALEDLRHKRSGAP